MFTKQLTANKSSSSLQHNSNADLQYEIFSGFMRQAGRQLSQKQSSLMDASSRLIQSFNHLIGCTQRDPKQPIDSCQTIDTVLSTPNISLSVQQQPLGSPGRRGSPFASRRLMAGVYQHLRQIQQKCSYGCAWQMGALVAEYKRQENKIKSYEAKQLWLNKRQETTQRVQQENLLLRKRLENQQRNIKQLGGQVESLKQENKSITMCISQKINTISANHRYFQINHKVFKDIKTYLSEKETLIKTQMQALAQNQRGLLKTIQQVFREDACVRCCDLLKKLKQSILKYRKYLQGETQQFEKLYDKYKKSMYSTKARPTV